MKALGLLIVQLQGTFGHLNRVRIRAAARGEHGRDLLGGRNPDPPTPNLTSPPESQVQRREPMVLGSSPGPPRHFAS
jgi:hypothetical protein